MGTQKQKEALDKKQAEFVRDVYGKGPSPAEMVRLKAIIKRRNRKGKA